MANTGYNDASNVPYELETVLTLLRLHYKQFDELIKRAASEPADVFPMQRLGEDLEEYKDVVHQFCHLFDPAEMTTLKHNIELMLQDLRLLHQNAVDSSHHGRPQLVYQHRTGQRGRPRTVIDPTFLRWAYTQRSTGGIAHYLGVSRAAVRNALLHYGIAQPGLPPFCSSLHDGDVPSDVAPASDADNDQDDIFEDAELPPEEVPDEPHHRAHPTQRAGFLSTISDTELDELVLRLRSNFRRAGITSMQSLLRRLNHIVPYERVRLSLLRIDPVARIFDRIRIRRRGYSVPGPMSLWHHDGQHGLIRWGIVIHGFIDGYSCYIVGLKAHDNNRASTVLDLFLAAASVYGVPSRIRGDHGVENLQVAAFMEARRGEGRGSYIWGRSVHNVRIERLWVDVTSQLGAHWKEMFELLEAMHGLDHDNANHIWLLHRLFLDTINIHILMFAQMWNEHKIRISGGPRRSPEDMFGFDSVVYGVRGDDLSMEELEVYGIDWEELRDDEMLDRIRCNYRNDSATSWLGRGPPESLNSVRVDPPDGPLSQAQLDELYDNLGGRVCNAEPEVIVERWRHGLAFAHGMTPDLF